MADAINIASYVLNRVLIKLILKKTPYENFKGGRLALNHLKVFGYKCFILNNGKDQIGKFDAKMDEGIFLGYATNSHAYKVYNKILMIVEASRHMIFGETNLKLQDQVVKNIDDEDILLEKQPVAVNESTEREKQSNETTLQSILPKV